MQRFSIPACHPVMKQTIGFILLLTITAGCKKSQNSHHQVELLPGQCKTNAFVRNTFTLCLDSVLEDSRCPINAICFWQGEAIAAFSLHINNEKHSFTLSTAPGSNQPVPNLRIVAGYSIRFVNLLPYPQIDTPPNNEPVRAILEINGF